MCFLSPVLSERFVGELNWLKGGGKRAGRVRTPESTPCSCLPCPRNLRKVKSALIWSDGVFARRDTQCPGSDLQLEHRVPPNTAAAAARPERCWRAERPALMHLPLGLLFALKVYPMLGQGWGPVRSRRKYSFCCTPLSKRLCR